MSDTHSDPEGIASPHRKPAVRDVPELNTSGFNTGVTDHAAERYEQRIFDGAKHAVRRAYAAGGELDPEAVTPASREPPDSARYDPLTDAILVVRDEQVTTVIDAKGPDLWPCIAAELERRGYSDE